ncbi:hypothetical protein NHQ30_006200 [Ciborinia camelliae]|nr:hypothetical protein NHQ30_006200 [Ciborinia camelliae]
MPPFGRTNHEQSSKGNKESRSQAQFSSRPTLKKKKVNKSQISKPTLVDSSAPVDMPDHSPQVIGPPPAIGTSYYMTSETVPPVYSNDSEPADNQNAPEEGNDNPTIHSNTDRRLQISHPTLTEASVFPSSLDIPEVNQHFTTGESSGYNNATAYNLPNATYFNTTEDTQHEDERRGESLDMQKDGWKVFGSGMCGGYWYLSFFVWNGSLICPLVRKSKAVICNGGSKSV